MSVNKNGSWWSRGSIATWLYMLKEIENPTVNPWERRKTEWAVRTNRWIARSHTWVKE